MMQSLGRRYVKYVNDRYRRTGTLWEGRYKASLVSTVEYMGVCSRYIELNPVRAGMVAHPRDYPWSSYRRNAEVASDPIVFEHETYMALSHNPETRRRRYRELFQSDLDPEVVDEIRRYANAELVFGNERFKDEIEQALERRARDGKTGRPKKGNSDQLSAHLESTSK
jgi:putative transposase